MRSTTFKRKCLRNSLLALACLTVLHLGAGPAFGQRATASVAGSILDASDAAVPSASVLVKNLDTGIERTVDSNAVGYYVVPALPAGRYSITITAAGFQTQTVPQLILAVDQNATVNVSLKVGAVTETVSVVGEAATVDTRTATLNTVINQKQIGDLPLNGRNVLQLIQLTPGTLGGAGSFNQKLSRSPPAAGAGTRPLSSSMAAYTKIRTPSSRTSPRTPMRFKSSASRRTTTLLSSAAAAAAS